MKLGAALVSLIVSVILAGLLMLVASPPWPSRQALDAAAMAEARAKIGRDEEAHRLWMAQQAAISPAFVGASYVVLISMGFIAVGGAGAGAFYFIAWMRNRAGVIRPGRDGQMPLIRIGNTIIDPNRQLAPVTTIGMPGPVETARAMIAGARPDAPQITAPVEHLAEQARVVARAQLVQTTVAAYARGIERNDARRIQRATDDATRAEIAQALETVEGEWSTPCKFTDLSTTQLTAGTGTAQTQTFEQSEVIR